MFLKTGNEVAMAFFPFMIELKHKNCLIVGGGKVAFRKAQIMLDFGAKVQVVGKFVCEDIRALLAEYSDFSWEERPVAEADLLGMDVVIMATDDGELNTRFAGLCRERHILVNVVDVKKDCDFYFPAIIKQEDVVVSVSTGGSSPLLASEIKKDIKKHLRTDYGRIAKELMQEREEILKGEPIEEKRKQWFEKKLSGALSSKKIRLGTRKSKLAQIQTEMVIAALKQRFPEYSYEMVFMTTVGDKNTEQPLLEFGGKAVFVEEFEQALADGVIDIAVHSAKDMPNPCKEGLCIAGTLKRACAKDVLIYPADTSITKDTSFTVGTSSLRRQYQMEEMYPKAKCKPLRGNIGTRMEKLRNGEYDAIILAAAGIERQGLHQESDLVYRYLSEEEMLPAAGQGIIAIETLEQGDIKDMVSEISDKESELILTVERAVLAKLNVGCHEPVGVYGTLDGKELRLQLMQAGEAGISRVSDHSSIENWEELVDKLVEAG